MVKAIVDDVKVELRHHDVDINLTGSLTSKMLVDSEAFVTVTFRVNSRNAKQWEALRNLHGSGPLEVELRQAVKYSDIDVAPRTEHEYEIGRRATSGMISDTPEASQGKDTW